MKKQKLVKRLNLKKTVVSSLHSKQVVGGTNSFRRGCGPIDLSLLETCLPHCNYTITCSQEPFCEDTGGGGTTGGTGGTGNQSGGISCPGYVC